jgi:hypothetical protein
MYLEEWASGENNVRYKYKSTRVAENTPWFFCYHVAIS